MTGTLQDRSLIKRLISPLTGTDNTAFVSQIIDTKGYDVVDFILLSGTLADADVTTTVLVEDGDDASLSDNAAVADANLIGTEAAAAFIFSDDDEVRIISYKPAKRYVRVTVTPANNTGSFPLAGVAILHGANQLPITQGAS